MYDVHMIPISIEYTYTNMYLYNGESLALFIQYTDYVYATCTGHYSVILHFPYS